MKTTLFLLWLLLGGCGGVTWTSASCEASTDTYASFGQTFIATECRSCHEHSNEYGTQAAVQASSARLEAVINSGRMPEGKTLSAATRTQVLAWLACGAP